MAAAATTTLYGIKNCDTVKKARRWLDDQQVNYAFHDFREQGLTEAQVKQWVQELGWETLVNKRSTTWKALAADVRDTLDNDSVVAVILANPTLIKRPLLDNGNKRDVGFSDKQYQALFKR